MKSMSFVAHLGDLRRHLLRIIVIVMVGMMVSYFYAGEISLLLLEPLKKALPTGGELVYLGILDKALTEIQIAVWFSVMGTSPLWFRELWLFLKPALYPKEVKIIRPFMIFTFIFFILGIFFAYTLVFPYAFKILLGFGPSELEAMISFKDYILLVCKFLLIFGLLFQLPNIMLILGFMGLVTKYSLRQQRPYVYLGFIVAAAMITPPDIYTMLALWLPLVLLYELGILAVALIVHPYLHRQNAPR